MIKVRLSVNQEFTSISPHRRRTRLNLYRTRMNNPFTTATSVLGRIFLSLIFLAAGLGKIFFWEMHVEMMEEAGLPYIPVLLAGAILFLLLGSLFVIFGFKRKIGALLLLAFIIPTTILFHDFWSYTGEEQQEQMMHFLKNLGLIGGLLLVLSQGKSKPAKKTKEKSKE
ncbi:MAG: DoxX family protein [Opitutales bacterium]